MNQIAQHSTHFRFRRFSHTAYAAFNSLHRVVNIGCIDGRIADLQLEKSHTHYQLAEPVFCSLPTSDESDDDEPTTILLLSIDTKLTTLTLNQRDAAAAGFVCLYSYLELSMSIIGSFFIFHQLTKLKEV